MKMSLLKNRPKDSTPEEFTKSWENIGYTLSALYRTLNDMKSSMEKVKDDDFSIPNHYALLAFQAGKKQMLEEIMGFLPESAKD